MCCEVDHFFLFVLNLILLLLEVTPETEKSKFSASRSESDCLSRKDFNSVLFLNFFPVGLMMKTSYFPVTVLFLTFLLQPWGSFGSLYMIVGLDTVSLESHPSDKSESDNPLFFFVFDFSCFIIALPGLDFLDLMSFSEPALLFTSLDSVSFLLDFSALPRLC